MSLTMDVVSLKDRRCGGSWELFVSRESLLLSYALVDAVIAS
jgi:hypothetical protein